MSEAEQVRTSVGGSGTVTVRQRPSLLLMTVPLRAAAPTLELRLAKLKKQCEEASEWLKRLNAARVEFGEPYFADQTGKDPLARMRALTSTALGARPAPSSPSERGRDVRMVLTAVWPIAALSAEEILVLVDRLRFEAATEPGAPETAEEPSPWATPEENLQHMMTQMQLPAADEGTPGFLFIAQLGEEQVEKASAEAFVRARQNAERLARAAGMRLGRLSMVHFGAAGPDFSRADKLLERQRCAALLAGCAYNLGEHEMVSDAPRAAEFTINVNVHYQLEPGPQV
jgi:hypothetical protein